MKNLLNAEKNRTVWVLMNMKLMGSALTESQIEAIVNGEVVREAEISEHIIVNRLLDALSFGGKIYDLQEEICTDTLKKFYRVLSEEEAEFRKSTPVLYHLSYNPVLPQEIDSELAALFRKVSDAEGDAVKKAVMIHNGIMRIYPFTEWNEVIARLALEYALIYYGTCFIPVTLTEQEYNQGIMNFLRRGESSVLEGNLRTNLLMIESMEERNN